MYKKFSITTQSRFFSLNYLAAMISVNLIAYLTDVALEYHVHCNPHRRIQKPFLNLDSCNIITVAEWLQRWFLFLPGSYADFPRPFVPHRLLHHLLGFPCVLQGVLVLSPAIRVEWYRLIGQFRSHHIYMWQQRVDIMNKTSNLDWGKSGSKQHVFWTFDIVKLCFLLSFTYNLI